MRVTESGSFTVDSAELPRNAEPPILVSIYPSSLSGTIRFAAVPEYPVICAVLSDRTLYVKSPDLLPLERTAAAGSSRAASGSAEASAAGSGCSADSGASGSSGAAGTSS